MNNNSITAIIVTHNPDIRILKINIAQAKKQVQNIIIVDNSSKNKDHIINLCKSCKCDFIEVGFNSGITYAIRLGIEYAVKRYRPAWILLLDQDSILLDNALSEVLYFLNSLPSFITNKIGIIAIGQHDYSKKYKAITVKYYSFSGTLIKPEIALRLNWRYNFFLDQADFFIYAQVRELGYYTLLLPRKMMIHRLGKPMFIESIYRLKMIVFKISKKIGIRYFNDILTYLVNDVSMEISYEPPWRYYYIIRNSLILLLEKRLDIIKFLISLIGHGLAIIFVDGIKKLLKPLFLGLAHGLLKREGVIDRIFFER